MHIQAASAPPELFEFGLDQWLSGSAACKDPGSCVMVTTERTCIVQAVWDCLRACMPCLRQPCRLPAMLDRNIMYSSARARWLGAQIMAKAMILLVHDSQGQLVPYHEQGQCRPLNTSKLCINLQPFAG